MKLWVNANMTLKKYLGRAIFLLTFYSFLLSAQPPFFPPPPQNIRKMTPDQILKSVLQEESPETVGEVAPEPETYRMILTPLYTTHIFPEVNLFPEVNAQVEKIYKRFGDRFNKGDPLIQLDSRVFKGIVGKAEAALQRANTQLIARKQLYKDHIASLFDLREAEAAVASAEADLILAKRNLEGSTIIAPYAGRVTLLAVEEREIPQQGKEMMEIIYDRTLIAKFLVPSTIVSSLRLGQAVSINIKETNTTLTAAITRIGAFIDPSSSTVVIEAEINNEKGEFKPGMTGSVSIKKDTNTKE